MPECKHDWAYDPTLFPTYPPIQRRICTICLTLEHNRTVDYAVPGKFEEAFARYQQQQSQG